MTNGRCGASWRSGYYEATFSVEDDGGEWTGRGRRTACSVCGFVVRAPAAKPGSKLLLQLATNTYLAVRPVSSRLRLLCSECNA
jgi:hypothetical protein